MTKVCFGADSWRHGIATSTKSSKKANEGTDDIEDPRRPGQVAAQAVHFDDSAMYVTLADGRTIKVPVTAYKRILGATPTQRKHYRLVALNTGIYWPDIDEHLSVPFLLRDFGTLE
jgi:hypothetical protein